MSCVVGENWILVKICVDLLGSENLSRMICAYSTFFDLQVCDRWAMKQEIDK